MRYPVRLTKDDNDTILVDFPDFPEAHTFGDDREEALARSVDALETIIDAYIKDRRPIPAPSVKGEAWVDVPALICAKINLYESMRSAKVGKAELGRRLQWHLPQIDRLLDVTHGSKLEQIEAAFAALGKRLVLTVVDEPTPVTARMQVTTSKSKTPHPGPAPSRRAHPPLVHAGVLTSQGRSHDRAFAGSHASASGRKGSPKKAAKKR